VCLVGSLALALTALGLVDSVSQTLALQRSFLAAGGLLVAWAVVVFGLARRDGRTLTLQVVLQKQHYIQACAQGAFLLYWGWYWRPVYDSAALIAAQLVFAYAFDMLLCWSRRHNYTLGFGPVPVIFSINLFLWFTDEWFSLQFLLIALGFSAKELIQWEKEGRRVHIFNPSSFPLAVVSLALILTGTSDITVGQEIAVTQFFPPYVYLAVFLVGLPGQYLFGVASMTMSAVCATYLFGVAYFAATGMYFFYDSYIPIAVFLGMHLLFTDPSTAPRTEVGRLLFGVLYGLSIVALYGLLLRAGVPTFYDKLLVVPLLNLSIQRLDRVARSRWLDRLRRTTIGGSGSPRRRNMAYVAVWAMVFGMMSGARGVGDRHPGQFVPFWQEACDAGRPYACSYLADMEDRFCRSGSAWACNEAGILHVALAQSGQDGRRLDPLDAAGAFARGCDRGFDPACQNLTSLTSSVGSFAHGQPTLQDYPIILRGTKGPIAERSPEVLRAMACTQGWVEACRPAED